MPKLSPSLTDILQRMAEAVVAVVGPHCEMVIYDFDDLEHAVVAVAGNVTGRRPGDPGRLCGGLLLRGCPGASE